MSSQEAPYSMANAASLIISPAPWIISSNVIYYNLNDMVETKDNVRVQLCELQEGDQ
jgi:hypothetical protein